MIKAILLIATCLIGTVSFASGKKQITDIQCGASTFDSKVSYQNKVTPLAKDDQQDHLVFTGNDSGTQFKVVISKADYSIVGSIETASGTSYSSKGSFDTSGNFEFSAMSGGNVMMPEKMIAIGCQATY
ncbi:MAG: hypothetical protein WA160_14405 [Pseudobdellovibrio sp.]